jgi:hypothetical protein
MMLALSLLVVTPISISAQVGTGTFDGPAKLRVKPGCGKDTTFSTWTFTGTGGAWTATVTSGAGVLAGTSAAVGSSGKIWNLAFDGPSKAAFDAGLAAAASSLCDATVTLNGPATITHFNLKLNKRNTRGKLTLFAQATGSTLEGTGRGTLKLIKRGPWQSAQ